MTETEQEFQDRADTIKLYHGICKLLWAITLIGDELNGLHPINKNSRIWGGMLDALKFFEIWRSLSGYNPKPKLKNN